MERGKGRRKEGGGGGRERVNLGQMPHGVQKCCQLTLLGVCPWWKDVLSCLKGTRSGLACPIRTGTLPKRS